MIKYKLTDQYMQTHGHFQWVLGEELEIAVDGTKLCSNQVFHFYDSPEHAAFFNAAHANIENPRLFEAEIDEIVAHDGVKGGCKKMKLVKELAFPKLLTEDMVEIAIKCSLIEDQTPWYVIWAGKWLDGRDRSQETIDKTYPCTGGLSALWVLHAARRLKRPIDNEDARMYAAFAAENAIQRREYKAPDIEELVKVVILKREKLRQTEQALIALNRAGYCGSDGW